MHLWHAAGPSQAASPSVSGPAVSDSPALDDWSLVGDAAAPVNGGVPVPVRVADGLFEVSGAELRRGFRAAVPAGATCYAVWRVSTLPGIAGVIAVLGNPAFQVLRLFLPGARYHAGDGTRMRRGGPLHAAEALYAGEARRHRVPPAATVWICRRR